MVRISYYRDDMVFKSIVVKESQVNDIKKYTGIHVVDIEKVDDSTERDYILK